MSPREFSVCHSAGARRCAPILISREACTLINPFQRRPLLVYEDHRASPLPGAHVGEGQAFKQLHKSTRAGEPVCHVVRAKISLTWAAAAAADRQGTHLLAEFHDPQVQATRDQDHAVPHQNAPREAPCSVAFLVDFFFPSTSPFLISHLHAYLFMPLRTDPNSSVSRKN